MLLGFSQRSRGIVKQFADVFDICDSMLGDVQKYVHDILPVYVLSYITAVVIKIEYHITDYTAENVKLMSATGRRKDGSAPRFLATVARIRETIFFFNEMSVL